MRQSTSNRRFLSGPLSKVGDRRSLIVARNCQHAFTALFGVILLLAFSMRNVRIILVPNVLGACAQKATIFDIQEACERTNRHALLPNNQPMGNELIGANSKRRDVKNGQ